MRLSVRYAFAFLAAISLSACVTSGPPKTSLTVADKGYFSFPTSTSYKGKNYNIGGDLTFPDNASGPVPLMLLVHSIGGINYSELRWKRLYLDQGYAVFMLDYLAPRLTDRNERPWPRSGRDVQDAIKVLQTHPRIDKNKIVVQGWSNGGSLTVSAASVMAGRNDTVYPRAFITLYGGCVNATFLAEGAARNEKSAAYRFYVGAEDTPVSPNNCETAAEQLGKAGIDAKAHVYPGVYHSFDGDRSYSSSSPWGTLTGRPNSEITKVVQADALAFLRQIFGG